MDEQTIPAYHYVTPGDKILYNGKKTFMFSPVTNNPGSRITLGKWEAFETRDPDSLPKQTLFSALEPVIADDKKTVDPSTGEVTDRTVTHLLDLESIDPLS